MTHIYIMIPGDKGLEQTLTKYIEDINDWVCHDLLQLNKKKTEVIVFVVKEQQNFNLFIYLR